MKTILITIFILLPFCAFTAPVKNSKSDAAALKTTAQPVPQNTIPGYCLFGGQTGKPFNSEAAFKTLVWKSDIIYIGETADQLAQLEALKAMREARGTKIAVGFEALNILLQPVLDNYAAGKISEEEFLQKTDWQNQGVDFARYKPIFDFIIQNKLKALALNIPKEIISKIEREGLSALNDDDKKILPAPVSVTKHKKYLEFLKASLGASTAGEPAWDNRLAAVSARNEGSGARIADFINANPGWSVLVTAGNDRLIYNAAIPASVKTRTVKLRQTSFYTQDGAKCPGVLPKEKKDLANYIWYISRSER